MLIWRPKAGPHEGMRPPPALDLRAPAAAALRRLLAEGGRPRQRQHVKIELTGGILPAILRRRRRGDADQDCENQQAKRLQQRRNRSPCRVKHGDPPYMTGASLAGDRNISRTK